jgi:hypothetical protein
MQVEGLVAGDQPVSHEDAYRDEGRCVRAHLDRLAVPDPTQ